LETINRLESYLIQKQFFKIKFQVPNHKRISKHLLIFHRTKKLLLIIKISEYIKIDNIGSAIYTDLNNN